MKYKKQIDGLRALTVISVIFFMLMSLVFPVVMLAFARHISIDESSRFVTSLLALASLSFLVESATSSMTLAESGLLASRT